ncbi:hypothetical protein ABT186_02300 [Streptomyces sp. NPDC001634]|uniref:hypothetical protein n=1 Tax=Streptomyces sp. NPDC001634 TaxID=3154390 RepID=UPI00332640FA
MTQQIEAERRATRVVAAVVVVVLTAGGSFIAGRVTAPAKDEGGNACASATAAMNRLLQEGKDAPVDEQQTVKDQRLATVVNVVLQNPNCFSADMRAQAQTTKDNMAAQANSDAAARAGECADPNHWLWQC